MTIERNFVLVVGRIWQPGVGPCAVQYDLSRYDLENIGEFNRENVSAWLDTHAGDFQHVQDFYATAGDAEIPWATEDGETAYAECTAEFEEV
jgi:hypothetical protein